MNSMISINNSNKNISNANIDISQWEITNTNKSEVIFNQFGSTRKETNTTKLTHLRWRDTNPFDKYLKRS